MPASAQPSIAATPAESGHYVGGDLHADTTVFGIPLRGGSAFVAYLP